MERNKKLNDFNKFLKEEITIKGNKGIPGEEDRNEPRYLQDLERRGQESIRGENPNTLMGRIMPLVGQSQGFSRGKEEELEQFAEQIIRNVYVGILDNIDLDIKFARNGREVANFMEEEEDDDQPPPPISSRDANLKLEVDKRKIANTITQGEAKNTKFIIEMPECRDGLVRILGERRGGEYHRILLEISRIATKLDWIIPVDAKADMMENAPEGMAGAVSIKYPKPPKEEKEKEKEEETEEPEGEEEELEMEGGNPVIKARGIDFAMLIHEAVKGIYELIATAGIPEDPKLAGNVMLNTSSFEDEAEDFKYGPYIAADLRDFINLNSNIDKYPNIREHVYGKLIRMPAAQFLAAMKGILMNTPEARKIVDDLVTSVIRELDEYEKGVSDFEVKQKLGEFDQDPEEHEESKPEEEENEPTSKDPDYASMGQRDLQRAIDAALDSGNYTLVGKISKYLKEGKEIYLRELERINEFHSRRK